MILEITLKNQISPFLQLSSKLSSKTFLFSTTKSTCRYPTLLQNTKFDLLYGTADLQLSTEFSVL